MKKSKQNYFTKHFETNIKNLKNTWKRMKSIISLRNFASSSTNVINFNNELTSDPLKIANIFNTILVQLEKKLNEKQDFQIKITPTIFMVKILILFSLHLHTVKKLFPLYLHSVITNLLGQIVYQQEY